MNNTSPLFSVVIPLFNKEPHIARAIQSVLSQEFTDYEILIVDDASTDQGLSVAMSFNDSRIRVLNRSQPGPGGYAARNFGIMNARGQLVAFLDADDVWYPGHLSALNLVAEQFPDAKLFGCGWELEDLKGKKIDPYYRSMHGKGNHGISTKGYLELVLSGKRPVHTSIACIRNIESFRAGIFPASLGARRGGDLHAWVSIVCRYSGMAWSDHIGGVYYLETVNMVTKNAVSSFILMSREIFEDLSVGLDASEIQLLRKYFNKRLYNSWLNNALKGNPNFFLPVKLFWYGDFLKAFVYSVRSILPVKGIL